MKVILNSGKVINNVRSLDATKSPIGLFVWSLKQHYDQILSFDKVSIRASQIAAIIDDESENKMFGNNEINITDQDLPFNM